MSDGVIIPPEIQAELLRQDQQRNPNGPYLKWSKYGLSVHNLNRAGLADQPFHSFYTGYLHNPWEALVEAHNREAKREGQ